MRRFASVVGSHPAMRLATAACLAGMLAGCADSERLADPFSNPFHTARNTDPTPTGTIGRAQPTIHSQPLAAPGPVAAYTAPAHPNPHLAWSPAYDGRPATTGSISHSHGGVAGWTVEGGIPVVVATGETAVIIAKRYSIPEQALLRTNGFSSASQVQPGTRLIIPLYNASLAASSGARVTSRRDATERLTREQAERRREKFEKEEAMRAQAKRAKLAEAERRERIEAKRAEERAEHERALAHQAAAHVPESTKIAAAAPEVTSVPAQKPGVDQTPTASLRPTPIKAVVASSAPEFRWPAHGRIIAPFKIGRNDGINIALPEGTAVHAAEAGVVAYAGNQLKGYGNLILIRHANGFVTAYANNGEIDVKRGEVVKRGQVIAKSGQTGNVTTPQLHFELRKGAQPVDPRQYLAGL